MKLSSLVLYSIAGTASSTVLIGDHNGQLYTMTDLTSGTATPLASIQLIGITSIAKDPLTGKIFLSGNLNGQGWVKELCGGAIKDISMLPTPGHYLDCITGGPRGVIAVDTADNSYGALSDCGAYTKIGQLPAPLTSGGYVFTQDEKGQLHVIDKDGNYYTQIAKCGWVKQATTFTPKHQGYCGYFKPDASGGTIYTGSVSGDGKIGTFNVANGAKGTLDVIGITGGYIVDLAVDVDTNRACTTCTPTAPTPTAPIVCPTTPTAPTIQTPTIVIAPTPTTPTKPTPTTLSTKKAGKKASSPISKGGKKSYGSNGSMMTGLMNTTEFNLTLGYFN